LKLKALIEINLNESKNGLIKLEVLIFEFILITKQQNFQKLNFARILKKVFDFKKFLKRS
jgi:hypothetical protein